MTLLEFQATLQQPKPLPTFSPLLQALWLDANDQWAEAHEIVQDVETKDAAAIHAYLHRKEGDSANARYWYQRAGLPFFNGSMEDEWDSLVKKFLKNS